MAEQKVLTRRRFFAGLGVVTAAGVAAKVAAPVTSIVQTLPAEPEGSSYRLTEHVKKYYRTTII